MSSFMDGLMEAAAIAQLLERWNEVKLLSVTVKNNPQCVDIETASREDFDKCCTILMLKIGKTFGNVERPLICAEGEYGGISVYVYGKAN